MIKRTLKMGLLATLALTAMTACQSGFTPKPRATLFEATEQNVMNSASHWAVLANNESAHIKTVLPDINLVGLPEAVSSASPFEKSYRSLLGSSLVANGVHLALLPSSATYQVEYDIQVVKHTDRETLRPRPGTVTAVYLIGTLASNIENWKEPAQALFPVAVGLDIFTALWRDTTTSISEVVVSTRVHDGIRVVSSSSNVYYFPETDAHNYSSEGRSFRVTSGAY